MSATGALAPDGLVRTAAAPRSGSGVWSVYRAERRKLATQLATRILALVCVLGPFAFAGVLNIQSGSPADTLFGIWVHDSGFAVSLVVLGFCGSWGFPVMAGVLAGDIFSSEDRYGTWKMVLTRSRTRRQVFAGKLLAAATFSVALGLLAAVASLAAGLLLVGAQPLVSLSGTIVPAGRCLLLVLVSWLLSLLPMLAFTSLAVLFSVTTRNGIIGVIGPALVALAMNLLALIGTGIWMHVVLAGTAFSDWNGLWLAHPFYGPLWVESLVSVVWIAACVIAAWLSLRRRDLAGTPVARRAGWVMPVRFAIGFAGLIVLLAIAGNWGPAPITAARLQANLATSFEQLTLLQQRELGRYVPAGTKLDILPSCNRRASTPRGPGEWICTLTVMTPELGADPFNTTPVAYDMSVSSDGCYKADSPPSFVGEQTMQAAGHKQVVNPLFVIYGCLDTL